MKNILKTFLSVLVIAIGQQAVAQCTVTATATPMNMVCGDSVTINVAGVSQGPVLQEDFNSMSLGPGWISSQVLDYSNPCGPSLDNTPSAWMGAIATQPRQLITEEFDLQCGAQICFDLDFADDDPCGGCSDCEDPDQSNEGVYFQYSTDGGTTWNTIFYFDPTAAAPPDFYQWDNYCFDLPAAGWSANTQFKWYQELGSGSGWDHWGIDNVVIQPIDCNNNYYVVYDDGTTSQVGDQDTTIMLTTTTTYDITFTNGIDDTCTTSVGPIVVDPYNVTVNANPTVLQCGDCTNLDMILNNPPVNNSATNFTYSWTPTTDIVDPNAPSTTACPSDNITYTGTITETNSGCTGQSTVNIQVNGGGAVADFDPFPALTGCPPLDITFTNTGIGQSFEWFIDGVSQATTTDFNHVFNTNGTYDVMLVAFFPGTGCINWDTMTVQVEVGNNIVPNADFDYNFQCGITAIDIWNTGTPGLTYTWDFGDGSPQVGPGSTDSLGHNFPSTGSYTVTLTVGDPICNTTNTYQEVINVVDNPITYIFNDPSCHDFSDGSIVVNLLYNTGNETFLITDSSGTQVNVGGSNAANQLTGGWYYLNVDLGFGCFVEDSVELWNPDELIPSVITTDVLCNGDLTGTAIVDTVVGWQGDYNQIAYFWNPNVGDEGLGADSAMAIGAGNYVLTINDDNGCSNTFDFTIGEPTPLSFSQLGSDPAYCRLYGYQSGNGVVYASATGGTADYDYVWEDLQDTSGLTLTSNTTWGSLNPGQYQITVVDDHNCVLTQVITVDSLNPLADFNILSSDFDVEWEGTAQVCATFENTSQYYENPNNPSGIDPSFLWTMDYPNQGWYITDDPTETVDTCYDDAGDYTICLVASNKNGCQDTACTTVTIYDPSAFQPVNIFTPNGDGDNDVFTFEFLAQSVETFQATIVNRWGRTVAQFNAIDEEWDGTDASGSECKDGVYFYTYEGTYLNVDANGDKIKFEGQGNVTIIREQK